MRLARQTGVQSQRSSEATLRGLTLSWEQEGSRRERHVEIFILRRWLGFMLTLGWGRHRTGIGRLLKRF